MFHNPKLFTSWIDFILNFFSFFQHAFSLQTIWKISVFKKGEAVVVYLPMLMSVWNFSSQCWHVLALALATLQLFFFLYGLSINICFLFLSGCFWWIFCRISCPENHWLQANIWKVHLFYEGSRRRSNDSKDFYWLLWKFSYASVGLTKELQLSQ